MKSKIATYIGSYSSGPAAWAVLLVSVTALFGLSAMSVSADSGGSRGLLDSLADRYERSDMALIRLDTASTLNDYLTHAAMESPALRKAFYRWRAAFEKSGYVGALPDPMVSYGYFIENVETRVGPQNQRFSFKQSIPWFGTLGAKKDVALGQAASEYQKYQSEKLKLFYWVKSAYFDLYYLGRNINLTSDNLELLTFWESVARVKYKVGLRQHPDIIKAQVELGMLEDRLLTLQDMVQPTLARLRAILNLSDSIDISIPTSIFVEESILDRDSIVVAALSNNYDMKAIHSIIDKKRSGVRLAAKKSLPTFTIGVDYIETGPSLNPSLSGSGTDPWIVGAKINLPIWFGKNKARKREAQAALRSAEYSYHDAQNRLRAHVQNILFKYYDALRKTQLYRDGLIPKAEQNLNASYTAYQADKADFLNVLDAQRQLLSFQLQYERGLSDLATRRAEIEMITGKEIDNQEPTNE